MATNKTIRMIDGFPFVCVAVLLNNGQPDCEGTANSARDAVTEYAGQISCDWDSVAVEVADVLATYKGRTIPTSSLLAAIQENRIEAGFYRNEDGTPKSREEKDALRARLTDVLPEYLRSKPDQFHVGRKTGLAIRFVEGENVLNKDGEDTGVQAYRMSDEEWKKATAPSAGQLAKQAAIEAAAKAMLAAQALAADA